MRECVKRTHSDTYIWLVSYMHLQYNQLTHFQSPTHVLKHRHASIELLLLTPKPPNRQCGKALGGLITMPENSVRKENYCTTITILFQLQWATVFFFSQKALIPSKLLNSQDILQQWCRKIFNSSKRCNTPLLSLIVKPLIFHCKRSRAMHG